LEQSGLFSFLLGRARCHHCGAPLSVRYPIVEPLCGALYVFLALRYPLSPYLIAVTLFSTILLLLAVIDIEHKLILNVIVLPAAIVALFASPIVLGGPDGTLGEIHPELYWIGLGGLLGGLLVTLGMYYLGALFLALLNRTRATPIRTVAFGMGDVKLSALLGALVGFPAIFFVVLYAILLGGVAAFFVIVVQLVRRRYSAFMAIPYGPYLILAGWVFMLWGRDMLAVLLTP
jgi:leader peptidase (prepilin peptidase)/N-methyltransferase